MLRVLGCRFRVQALPAYGLGYRSIGTRIQGLGLKLLDFVWRVRAVVRGGVTFVLSGAECKPCLRHKPKRT